MTDPTAATSAVYDAIDTFQRTHRLPGLQHAQIRGLLAEHLARVLPLAVPAGQAPATDQSALDLAQRITRAIHAKTPPADWPQEYRVEWEEALDAAIDAARVEVSAVLPAPADRAAALTDAERTMLTYALDQAQERIWSEDGFTAEDQAAVDSLRRMAAEAGPATAPQPVQHAAGKATLCPDCRAKGHSICMPAEAGAADTAGQDGGEAEGCGCLSEDDPEHMFGSENCDCIPFTRQEKPPRYLNQPTDTVDVISGWEIGPNCPHHRYAIEQAAAAAQSKEARPPVAYGDGKGTACLYCLQCPRPDNVDVPLTADDIEQWECCSRCGTPVVDIAAGLWAAAQQPKEA